MRPENLVIRAVEDKDAEGLTRLQNMPGFRFGTLRMPFQRLDTTKKWLQSLGPEATIMSRQSTRRLSETLACFGTQDGEAIARHSSWAYMTNMSARGSARHS